MSSPMRGVRLRTLTISLLVILALSVLILALWFRSLDKRIQKHLEEGTYAAPIEFYAAPQTWLIGQNLNLESIDRNLQDLRFNKRRAGQSLAAQDYMPLNAEECRELSLNKVPAETENCVLIRGKRSPQQLGVFAHGQLAAAYSGVELSESSSLTLDPVLFAQYYGDQPLLRRVVRLSQVPNHCLNAVLAIEDPLRDFHDLHNRQIIVVISDIVRFAGNAAHKDREQLDDRV